MNLRQIEVFRAVMLAGSITEAAGLLRISQPAVSRLLRHTEDRLGTPLFNRVKGRLYPTTQAHALYQEVERLYKGVRRVQDIAQEIVDGRIARLRVVACPGVSHAFLARAITLFRRHQERVKISLELLPQAELIKQIITHQADLGVSMLPVDHPLIEAHPLGEGRLVCVAPKHHPLAERDVVRPVDLNGYPLISYNPATPQGVLLEDTFAIANTPCEIAIEVTFGHLACALVQRGAGVALIDEFAAMSNAAPGTVARPFKSNANLQLTLIHDRSRPLSAAGSVFHDVLKKMTAQLSREAAR